MRMSKSKELTKKEKIFFREYLVDLNAAHAAIRAGYSKNTAKQIGYNMLNKPSVAAAVQEAMDKRAKKTEITAEYVLKGIKEVTESAIKGGELNNALRGFELMGKHLKLFTEVHEQHHTFTQMGRVVIGDPNALNGTPKKELFFDIGSDPNVIDLEPIKE